MQVLRTSKSGSRIRSRSKLVLKPGPWRSFIRPVRPGHPRSYTRRIASNLLISVGVALCAGVTGTYSWMFIRQELLLKQWKEHNRAVVETLTKLQIPRINLEDIVLEGTSQHSLLLGPAHLTGSAEPGSPGNAVIAGHRDTFFRRVHSLRYGDDIYVLRSGRRFHYRVCARKVVEPTDLSVLRPTRDPELTLITCYPTHAIGPAPRRLIVVAKLASGT